MHRVGVFVQEAKTKKGIQIVMLTTFGLKQNEYSDIAQEVIDVDDLFGDVEGRR